MFKVLHVKSCKPSQNVSNLNAAVLCEYFEEVSWEWT